MSSVKIITTEDGSHSLFNEDMNETYHSVHGAIRESVHVFINSGLCYYLEKENPGDISILEVGFGTGLNALLTLEQSIGQPVNLHYTSIEGFPIPEELWSELNYSETIGSKDAFLSLHRLPWEMDHVISAHFTFKKHCVKLEEIELAHGAYDLIYFDAFAPAKQPELWTLPILEKIVKAMDRGAVFVTYCAKGQLKRDLKALGLSVETLPGPPGKLQMVRATKVTV